MTNVPDFDNDADYDARMVASGTLAPKGDCVVCDRLRTETIPGYPSHTGSTLCRSGGRNHCTCDLCY